MEISASWQQNIDPLLRQVESQNNPEFCLSWQQPQPLQKWITEPERALFTAGPLPTRPQGFPRCLVRPTEGVPSLPKAPRMTSPSFSQDLSSQCSSARSPGTEFDLYSDSYYPLQEEFLLPNSMSQFSQGLPDPWQDQPQIDMFPQIVGNSCVSLNQVQTFEDQQDAPFDLEGYGNLGMKTEYIDVDQTKPQQYNSFRLSPSDEGIGASIKDEGSPANTATIYVDDASITDADADADIEEEEEEEEIIPEDPVSDTEYSPKSTRTRKRQAPKTFSSPNIKRRVIKNPRTKTSFNCKSCSHSPFKDAASLQRHVNAAHTRAFTCVFAFAGCTSTFASKNEWKRHTSSQHLNLNSWVCEQGNCGKVHGARKSDGSSGKGSAFNRKDLFTQHLRRMHAPFDVKRKNKKNPEWENTLKELQVSCVRVKRSPPTSLECPLLDCDSTFEGANCWDDRMEHVGKHLEKAAISTGADKITVHQEYDRLLVDWATHEHIIEQKAGGGYRLSGAWFEGADVDAEGDDDY